VFESLLLASTNAVGSLHDTPTERRYSIVSNCPNLDSLGRLNLLAHFNLGAKNKVLRVKFSGISLDATVSSNGKRLIKKYKTSKKIALMQ
jgi:hypothetical protein